MNSLTFGPALIVDGEAQTISTVEHAPIMAAARICICQLDHLKYANVVVDGGNGVGISLQELADFIPEILPECKVAYNLDGGKSIALLSRKRDKKRPISVVWGGAGIVDIMAFTE